MSRQGVVEGRLGTGRGKCVFSRVFFFFHFSFKEEDNEWACEFLQGQNEHPVQTGMVALLLNAYAVWAEVGKVNKCDSHQISV